MLDLNPDEGAAVTAFVDTGFDTTPVSVTVNRVLASPPAPVEAGFGELDGTPSPIQAAPTINAEADTGTPEDPEDDLDARVAAPPPNKPITDWNAVQAFMAAVVPWPASPNDAGWVNLHYSFIGRDGKYVDKPLGGACFKEIGGGYGTFMNAVQWRLAHPDRTKSMWFCMSMQKHEHVILDKHGKPKAQRSAKDAVFLKSIWIDVDIKPNNPKCYPDINTALAALQAFVQKVGLPPPSAVVRSGGGLHVYWISREPMATDVWRVYANGLKQLCLNEGFLADTGLMADASRVLRMPGTLNAS
jgi:hypothetical protein